jgi:hypothetical protein|uniref:Heparinase II/III-like C-terminal domain-containing protein n=1 Tax=Desulfobacca acetoxidans TaxID=60893 RepID=A0A7V6DQS8_9BACT
MKPILLAVVLGCAILLLSAAGHPEEPEFPGITPQALIRLVKKEHPRLLVQETDFVQLQRLIQQNAAARKWYAAQKRAAARFLVEPPCSYKLAGENGLLASSRAVLDRVYTLALVYKVEGGGRYLHRLWEELEAAAAYPDWHPRHFLDTAEMTHAFAVAYDWLYAAWTGPQRQVLAQTILEKGLKPALAAYRDQKKTGWWAASPYNWNLVANSGIGLGALAVSTEAPEIAAKVLDKALHSLPRALARLNPDGGSSEGPLYWGYSTFYTCVFLAALDTALGKDFGLAQTPGLAATGFFPLYLTGPTGKTFNYADSPEKIPWLAQLFWLARKYDQPLFALPACGSPRPHPLGLVWRDFAASPKPDNSLPLDRYFRGIEVAAMRSSWQDDQGTFVALKAGDNRAGHAHLDLGTFVLDAQGQRWALDLGPDDYNLPGYFGPERWDYYRTRAEGHNTLVINPGRGPDQNPAASARISRFYSSPQLAWAIADLTPAYAHAASKVWRGLALVNRRQVLIEDEIETRQPAAIWWFLHTPAMVRLSADKKSAILTQNSRRWQARLLQPENATFKLDKARPLPLSPHPHCQKDNPGVQKLAVNLEPASKVRLVVWLTPLPEGESAQPPPPVIIPLADW